jgi:hypothetical protein
VAKIIPGIVRGNSIEFLEPHGLAEGEKILLEVRMHDESNGANGIIIGSGETVDGPFWDEVLDEFYQRRKKNDAGENASPPNPLENLELD